MFVRKVKFLLAVGPISQKGFRAAKLGQWVQQLSPIAHSCNYLTKISSEKFRWINFFRKTPKNQCF
jgi:hypothetical protein